MAWADDYYKDCKIAEYMGWDKPWVMFREVPVEWSREANKLKLTGEEREQFLRKKDMEDTEEVSRRMESYRKMLKEPIDYNYSGRSGIRYVR